MADKKFIAYFDFLGFKQFVENNDLDYQKEIVNNNFRDMEISLSKGKLKEARFGKIADLSNSKINCINFSDTIVFWTNDDSENSLLEILEVAYTFNWRAIDFFFPVRGSLVYGEIEYIDFKEENKVGGLYNVNSVFGKGLVRAHEKTEAQHWAGTVFDDSIVAELRNRKYDVDEFLKPYAKKFIVPYKCKQIRDEEFAMRIIKGQLNETAFGNVERHIRDNFKNHNKSIDKDDVKEKIENTIIFLKSFCAVG